MVPKTYQLAQRLSVRACQTEKLKAGMISLSIVLPISREHAHLTSLLLSVLHRGTEHYPTIAALNRKLDYLFGTEMSVRNYYRGDRHVIGIAADLLGQEYLPADCEFDLMEEVLLVMREILFHPLLDENGLFSERYVESEKRLQCDSIRSLRNSPRAYAIEHCSRMLYENEPCGVPIYGTEEQISAVRAEDLTAHWRDLVENMRVDCFYVGPESAERVCERVEKILLPELPEREAAWEIPSSTIVRRAERVRRKEEDLPVSQGQLVLGLRTGVTLCDEDYYACAVANEILGVSPISKLFVNVRERHGLCYHCSSHYNMYKGTVLINCGLLPENRALAEKEILNQISAIANGEFEDEELSAAKMSLENSYRQIEDSATALESYYLGRALCEQNVSLEACRAGFAAVRREDILRVARGMTVDTVYFLNGTAPDASEEAEDEAD